MIRNSPPPLFCSFLICRDGIYWSVPQSEYTTNGVLRCGFLFLATLNLLQQDAIKSSNCFTSNKQIFRIMNVSIFVKEILYNLIRQ